MAESEPDPNVEDVLSSVRRLVSQEIPRRRPKSRGLPTEITAKGALVLTANDRVEKDHAARANARSLEQKIAELEAAVEHSADEFEPDGSEDQALHRPDRIVYTRPRSSEEAVGRSRSTLRLSEIALVETDSPEDDGEPDDVEVSFRSEHSMPRPPAEAPMAEDVPPVQPTSAEVRAFSDPDDVVARIEARIERGPDAVPESTEPKETTDEALSAAVRASIAESRALDIETEEVEAPSPVEPETQIEPTPAPEPAPAPDPEPVAASPTQAVEADPASKAAAALDAVSEEEVLRLLVGRLMREELQGDLGTRITGIVRKLVRSEVKRLQDSRDLD